MTSGDLGFFSYSPRRMVWSEGWLGRLAHRIASFLLRGRQPGLPAVIAVSSRYCTGGLLEYLLLYLPSRWLSEV